MSAFFRALFPGGVFALVAPGVSALRADPVREVNNALANQAVSIIEAFSATNSVATGSFHYFNENQPPSRFDTYRLPLRYYVDDEGHDFRLFFGGALGYFELNQREEWGPAIPLGDLKIDCVSALAGPGFDWYPLRWLRVTPHAAFFYSYERFRFSPSGPVGESIARIVPNWGSHDVGVAPSLEMRTQWWAGPVEYGLSARFTSIFARSLGGDGETPYIRPESYVWRNEVYARYHTPWEIGACPVIWGAAFARHDLAGDVRNSGFLNHFYEVRSSLALRTEQALASVDSLSWLREVEFSAAYYFGERFSGISVGVSADF